MPPAPPQPAAPPARHAFSLVEMVMVVATIAIIAAIAIPRITAAAGNAQSSAMVANVTVLQNAVDTYAAEHNELDPSQNADQTVSLSGSRFGLRLLNTTTDAGVAGGVFGPYLLRVPRNPDNDRATIRIDGAPAGANLAGWRFNSQTGRILPDHIDEATAIAIIQLRGAGKAASSSGSASLAAGAPE